MSGHGPVLRAGVGHLRTITLNNSEAPALSLVLGNWSLIFRLRARGPLKGSLVAVKGSSSELMKWDRFGYIFDVPPKMRLYGVLGDKS